MTSMRICLLAAILVSNTAVTAAGTDDRFSFGPFGEVVLYVPQSSSGRVVLFVSGDGGWNKGVVDMARALTLKGMTVAGIDITRYVRHLQSVKDRCAYLAADFEALGQFIQKKLRRATFEPPLLVGYSSGATLVYAALAQAPESTFAGGVSLGFCPDLQLSTPLCHRGGLETRAGARAGTVNVLPAVQMQTSWIALQGDIDEVCDPQQTALFVGSVAGGRMIALPKVGHGFSVQKNWMPEFLEAVRTLNNHNLVSATKEPALADLPVVRVKSSEPRRRLAAIVISGDGGWAELDKKIAESLAAAGIEVLGLDSLRYFWQRRSPDEASAALARMLEAVDGSGGVVETVVIGYSFGAEVLPFMVNRLPETLQRNISAVVLLGPGSTAEFEFHLTHWLGGTHQDSVPTFPEVSRMRVPNLLCVQGEKEEDSLCQRLTSPSVRKLLTKGSHHFGGDYDSIVNAILGLVR